MPAVKCTLTDAEAAWLDRQCEVTRTSRAAYMRNRTLGRPVVTRDHEIISNKLTLMTHLINEKAERGLIDEEFRQAVTEVVIDALRYLTDGEIDSVD